MNITEALNSGKPVCHPDMIGAYWLINGNVYHVFLALGMTQELAERIHEPVSPGWITWPGILRDDWRVCDEAS